MEETVASVIERVDAGWHDFGAALAALPAERLSEHIGQGWTRKQMLAHLGAWHDHAADRLAAFLVDGEVHRLDEDDDTVNARVARGAEGRTTGEILDALETSFRRLRRQIGYLANEQLAAHDGWPLAVIASNTYEHYAEHRRDIAG